MGQNSVWIALLAISALKNTSAANKTTFGFYPDRDNDHLFSLRIPISVVSGKDTDISERVSRKAVPHRKPDFINVKIENDEGYICAEETTSSDLEVTGLPCSRCMNGKLLVTVETKKGEEILFKINKKGLYDESRRAEICNLKPEERKQGESLVITSPKQNPEDGCRWVFRDAGSSTGCCFSNRDYYTQTGGCDPRMQSSSCRKGSEEPILEEEENSCTLHINNLRPADTGNYLSSFHYATPGYKKVLIVEGEFPTEIVIISIVFFFFIILTSIVIYLCVQRKQGKPIYCPVKENLVKVSSAEKTRSELQDDLETSKL